jgi:hypothetical protein
MQLSPAQKESLRRDGFVLLRNALPVELVERALTVINHGIGEGMSPDKMPIYRAQSYVPELQVHPAVTDLLHASPLRGLTESVFGVGGLEPVTKGQITVRFPELEARKTPRGHIDGFPTATNGVPAGTIRSFTGLLGVYLTPVRRPDAGNFTVWPGSHETLSAHFRAQHVNALINGMPDLDLGPPNAVQAEPGDAVLAHYMLAHSAGVNRSPYPRYMVFFRLKHRMHKRWPDPAFVELWNDWPGCFD